MTHLTVMKEKNLFVRAHSLGVMLFTVVAMLGALPKAHAVNYDLQGQSRGSTTWLSGNLQNWRELDYIPCRVYITGGPVNNRLIRITFPHLTGTTPGFQDLINFRTSSNAVITVAPVLSAPMGADWSYTFTVTVLDANPAAVYFESRLAAGAHLNPGSSLALSGFPSSMGNLQIHKPSAGPGAPDLVIVKSGPVTAQPGQIITYSMFYTNIATATPAVGVQISDILPPEVTVIPSSLGTNAHVVGNSIFWDLGNVLPGQNGQVSFQVQITNTVVAGQVVQNYSQILSSENDVNYANNSSIWNTTIVIPCVGASIAGHPLSQEICLGEAVTLSVAANGSTPLGYQWRKGGANILGATNDTYFIPSVTMADLGGYDVVVANSCGGATSTVAQVSLSASVGATPLVSQTNCIGGSVMFSTTASGPLPISYQWFKDGVEIPDQLMNTLTLTNLTLTDAGVYAVVVSGACNSVSNSATLTISALPTINCATNKTVESGVAWDFDLPVVGGGTLTVVSTVTNTGCGNTLTAIRTWQVADSCGNATQCSQTVNVVDTTAPVITCAANKSSECGATFSFDAPTASDGTVSVVSTVTNAASCSYTVTRTWAATDACGNSAQCSQTISVVDTTAPTITCVANKNVEAGAAFSFDLPTVVDGCSTSSVSVVNTVTNTIGCSYNVVRTWSATDACGNSAQCSQTINVVDTTAPTITCVANKNVEAGAAFSFDQPTATDVGGTNAISIISTVTNVAGCSYSVTRTWAATDACGNSAQCSQTISVVDTTAPTITCVANKSVEAGAAFSFDQPTATDIGGTNAISIVSTVTNVAGCSYSVTRTWRVTDACGNAAQCSQTISVVDTTAPTITCVANKSVEAGAAFSFDQPTATDVGGTNSISIVSTVTNVAGCSYNVVRTWRATDACGNNATCSQTINVVDTTAPTITCVANKNVEAGAAFSFDQPTATDIGGTNAISIVSTVTNAAGCSYSVTRTWRATDACGNSAQCSQTISVVDTTAPTITCVANKNVEAGAAFSFDQPTATDIGGTNSISIVSTVTNAAGCSYNVVRTWRATDACGNSAQCSQTISMVDTTAPTITCVANKNVEAGAAFGFDQPTATDVGGTNSISIVSTVTNAAGCSYSATRTWRATDACGNSATCSQTISVVDTTAPTITCATNKIVEAGSPITFDQPTAADIGGTNNISIVSTVTNAAGCSYSVTRTWRATDACGNSAQCSQSISVVDTTAPTITCVANKTVSCGQVWTFDDPTVTGGSLSTFTTVTNLACGNTFSATRTWAATDACGNSAQCSQTVTVIDTTAPVITCATNKTVLYNQAWTFDAPTALDGCGTNAITIVSTITNATCGANVVAIRTWRATDACGNTAQCSQSVTVIDDRTPVLNCVADKTAACGSVWTFDLPFVSQGVITNVTTVTNAACGNTLAATRTWTAVDSCGNTKQCSQTVVVQDTTAPTITCVANKSVEAGSAFSFDQPTATDTCGTNSISIVSTVTNTAGCSYAVTRTWRATDACGNAAQCSQTINVVDTTAPTITCVANKSVEAGAAFSFDQPTATDVAGTNAISIVSTVTNVAGCSYSVTRTWRATDACGNAAQCSQTISVVDTTAPTITCVANKSVEAGAAFSFDVPTAGDGTISVLSTVTNSASCSYAVTRTWAATDACGNNAQCSQTITVLDTTAPTLTIISPTNSATYITPATVTFVADAFDASGPVDKVEFYIGTNKVGEAFSAPYSITLSNLTPGVYAVVAAAADACGNASASAAVSVNVLDKPPLSIVGQMRFNPQTGLFEQTVRVFNPTGSEYQAVRVYISNLASNVVVYNRTDITNGVPYIQSASRVLPGSYVDLLIEYYVPTRVAPNPTLIPQLVPLGGGGFSATGNGQNIERGVMLPNQTFLLEFSTVAGRTYFIQYSSDLVNWQTAQQPITGNGSRVQWIDNGQPKTVSPPSAVQYRFYRLSVVP